MTAIRDADGNWIVTAAGSTVAGPFRTMAEAWRWIDRRAGDPISPAEKKSEWITTKIMRGST